ncbi:MATE family efflux transporter [Xanthovirga aplysinae]|uniref:MATE family efflux transporter n=1 Tax=Xanthovirga aplysinae TaxID=2529853 RepID=UPI0012BC5470|nr:MATE family efflux transporter [Xanthovirga aplysinae]MTI33074.1 MATE family efflux transporter [Xanthovirga aplysinae]
MENEYLLGKEKVSKALMKLSLPASIGILVLTLYNVIDTIFVGQIVGPLAIGGVAVVLPISMLISTIGMGIGIGGSSLISRQLGAKHYEKARYTFGTLTVFVILVGVLTIILGYIFEGPILSAFGATGDIESYAKIYFRIILAGSPFLGFGMMANNVARSEGNSKIAMYSMIFSAVLNTILDAVFMIVLDMGLAGAAYATLISQIAIALYFVWFFNGKKSLLSLSRKYWNLNGAVIKETTALGSSSFARQGAASIIAALINQSLIRYGGELYVAIYGIIFRVLMFTFFPMIGIVQGFLPLAGYNYGARNFKRVREVFRYASIVITAVSIFCFILVEVFSKQLFEVFTTDSRLIEDGSPLLQIIGYSLPLIGFQMVGASYFQAIGKSIPALLLTLSRQFIFMIPLIFLLPTYFGLEGVFYSFPLADVISFIVTFLTLIPFWKMLNKEPTITLV